MWWRRSVSAWDRVRCSRRHGPSLGTDDRKTGAVGGDLVGAVRRCGRAEHAGSAGPALAGAGMTMVWRMGASSCRLVPCWGECLGFLAGSEDLDHAHGASAAGAGLAQSSGIDSASALGDTVGLDVPSMARTFMMLTLRPALASRP